MRAGIGALVLALALVVSGPLLAQTTTTQAPNNVITQTYSTSNGSGLFSGMLGSGFGSSLFGSPYRAVQPSTVSSSIPNPTNAKQFLAPWNFQRPFHK
jgi:hypothetical protein